jgi:hypothetical protein
MNADGRGADTAGRCASVDRLGGAGRRGGFRLAKIAVPNLPPGHEMRNSCKDPMKRGAGRRGRNGRRRHRTARLAVVAGRGMRFSRVDAMQRGAGQRRRAVRVRTGRHGWRVRWGTECDFAQRPNAMGSGPAAPGWPVRTRTARLAGAAGHGMRFSRVDAMQRGAGQRRRAVRVRTGRHGWRVRWGTECDFAQRPYAMGSGPAAPAWPGSDRTARLAGAAGHGMRFSRVDAMQRGAGQQRRAGRARTGRHGWRVPAGHAVRFSCVDAMQRGAGQQRRAVRVRTRMARLAGAAGHGMRFSRKDPMKRGTGRRGRGADVAAGRQRRPTLAPGKSDKSRNDAVQREAAVVRRANPSPGSLCDPPSRVRQRCTARDAANDPMSRLPPGCDTGGGTGR